MSEHGLVTVMEMKLHAELTNARNLLAMKDDALSSMTEIYEKIQTYLGIDPGDLGERADGEILHRIHAKNKRITELEADVASLEYLDDEAKIGASEIVGQLKEAKARIAELEHAFDKQKEYIARLEAAQRWVPVGERLPEADKRYKEYTVNVLAINSSGVQHIAFYVFNSPHSPYWTSYDQNAQMGTVTHWMPLPEPPEAKS